MPLHNEVNRGYRCDAGTNDNHMGILESNLPISRLVCERHYLEIDRNRMPLMEYCRSINASYRLESEMPPLCFAK